MELVKWDPNIVWNSPTLPDLSKTRASELREEALLWRHDFEKELAREKIVRARLLERKAISDSMDQVCTLTDILLLNNPNFSVAIFKFLTCQECPGSILTTTNFYLEISTRY